MNGELLVRWQRRGGEMVPHVRHVVPEGNICQRIAELRIRDPREHFYRRPRSGLRHRWLDWAWWADARFRALRKVRGPRVKTAGPLIA